MAEHEAQNPNMEDEELRSPEETVMDAFVRHQKDAAKEAKMAFEALVPDGFKAHGREAKKAFKRGVKVVLEEIAAHLEAPEDEEAAEQPPSTTGPNKVKVEVN
jgi:hypothetical protein